MSTAFKLLCSQHAICLRRKMAKEDEAIHTCTEGCCWPPRVGDVWIHSDSQCSIAGCWSAYKWGVEESNCVYFRDFSDESECLVHAQEEPIKPLENRSWAKPVAALRAQMVSGCDFNGNREVWSMWDTLHKSCAQPQTDFHTTVFSTPSQYRKHLHFQWCLAEVTY